MTPALLRWVFPVAVAAGLAAQTVDNVKQTELDVSVPESPGFAVLGLTPQNVLRPGSLRELASTVLNGVDENGNFQTGIAFDLSPYLFLFGNGVQLSDYRPNTATGYLTRFFSRTQLSVATTKGAGDEDKSSRLGVGLRLTLVDFGDARADSVLAACLVAAATQAFDGAPPIPPSSTPEEQQLLMEAREKLVEKTAAPCRQAHAKRRWNRSAWTVGTAWSWTSLTGNSKDLDGSGDMYWTSVGYGFEGIPGLQDTSQIIVHARFRNDERIRDPQNTQQVRQQDTTLLGGRMRFGTEAFAGNFEGVYFRLRPLNLNKEEYARLSFGVEKRIADNLWLNVSFGGESGRRNGENRLLILGGLKWAFSEKPVSLPAR